MESLRICVIFGNHIEKTGTLDDVAAYLVSIEDWQRESRVRGKFKALVGEDELRPLTSAEKRSLACAVACVKDSLNPVR